MIALDSETTGVDLRHGAKPFFVTTCDEAGECVWWEWDVDPLTRQPCIPDSDLIEISEHLFANGPKELILQNPKFDFAALDSIDFWRIGGVDRDKVWNAVKDTLIAGHLLASNQPKDLTTLALVYLGINIQPYEDRVEKVCNEARSIARRQYKDWRIAKKDADDMPSAKEKTWKYDMWLPKALAQELGYPDDHPWYSATREYANADSGVMIPLYKAMLAEVKRRGLEEIYNCRLKVLPVVHAMEARGITISGERLEETITEYTEEATRLGNVCVNIAEGYGHELVLPKGATPNNSLRSFIHDVMKLPPVYNAKSKTCAPTLDSKNAMPFYLDTLPQRSKERKFIECLVAKRSRDTAISYMNGYARFWLPNGSPGWYVLHPSLNPTGTDTLRFSSSNPNEQNISKKEGFNLRYTFGPAPGREWWSLDAKNIELRIPAYESGEQAFIDLFERPDDPPYYGSNHLLIAHLLFPEEFNACRKDGILDGRLFKKKYASTLYQRTKNGNFAVQYGAVDRADGMGTADRTYGIAGAQARIKSKFKKQEALNQHWINFAKKYGYVETMPDKTVDPSKGYPLLCSRTDYGDIKPTVPLNYHVQGCLSGDSRVLTNNGLIPIRELVGTICSVWTGFKWASATGLNRGKCQRASIILESGLTIECDTRHILKNHTNEWTKFDDLRVGDYIALPSHIEPLMPSEGINWWFVFGFIIGDGCLSDARGRKTLSAVGGLTKKPILEDIFKFIQSEGYTGNKDKYRDRGGVIWREIPQTETRSTKFAVTIENKDFAKFLESQGFHFSWKSGTKRIPESVWRSSLQNQRDFLEGLWMSDGTRAKTSGSGRGLNMCNQQLLKEVQVLASAVGFDSMFARTQLRFRWKAFNAKSSRPYPAATLTQLVTSVEKSNYNNMGQFVTDKRNFVAAQRGKDVSQYVAERIVELNNPEAEIYRYDRIVSITVKPELEDTYTLSVDDPLHQFVADGVIHKNTAMWWMMKAMIRCQPKLREWQSKGFDGYMIMQVHDEIVFDFPKRGDPLAEAAGKCKPGGSNLWRIRILQKLMEEGGNDIGLPTPVSCEYNPVSWDVGIPV